MNLSAKPIITWGGVNSYVFGNQWIINNGNTQALYFQILDTDQAIINYNSSNFFAGPFTGITAVGSTAGLRYLVGIGSQNQPYQVQVTFPSIDPNQQLTVTAIQADPNDSSIWYVNLAPSMLVGGGNVQFTIYQGNNIMRFSVIDILDVLFPTTNGMC
jgi:hypothetical protein